MPYNLLPKDRAVLWQGMLPIVTQQFVPSVWKGKWEIIKPFLLD